MIRSRVSMTNRPMYAVIATGGKQEIVRPGQRVSVERLGVPEGTAVSFTPVLVVDGDTVLARAHELSGAVVTGRVEAIVPGKKIRGFTYKPKTRSRRRYGHRQWFSAVRIEAVGYGDHVERVGEQVTAEAEVDLEVQDLEVQDPEAGEARSGKGQGDETAEAVEGG